MKKLKIILNVLIKISFVWFVFFMLFPSIPVKAMFSDTANLGMDIKLELGSVSLFSKDTTIIDSVKFTEGDSVTISSSDLMNDGSLSGKLAYKIDVTKENGSMLTVDELKNTVISIDFGTAANKVEASGTLLNENTCSFVKDTSGRDIVLEPDSMGKIPVTISYKSSTPTKEEKLKIKVTFRLIQSNAAKANANLFFDEVTMENVISLIPKVIEEKSYWPDKSTFINVEGKLSYSLEKMNMVFSEVYDTSNSNIKNIRNLNEAVLYIQLPKDEPLKTKEKRTGKEIDSFKVISMVADDNGKINVEKIEIDEINHGIKITFNLEDSYDSSDPNKVREYTNKYRYPINIRFQLGKYTFDGGNYGSYTYYSGVYYQQNIFASRLVLSSDIPSELKEANFEKRKIYLSEMEKTITIKQIKSLSSDSVKNDEFKDVQLTKGAVSLEVEGGATGQISSLLTQNNTLNNEFSLKLNPGGNSNVATLNVKITGDTKNTLVISRKLELQNYLVKIKSAKISPTTKEVEQQTNSEEKIEESSSMIDSTLPNDKVIEEPIDGEDQEEVEVEEVIDSSSPDSDAELKEETVPIENSNQSIPEVKISDE